MDQHDIVRRGRQVKIWDYVETRARQALQRLLEAFMEHERDLFLGCHPWERTPEREGYRNGFQQRTLQSRWGLLRLRKPRVRGTHGQFRTLVFDRYKRRQRQVEQAVLGWIASGLSTREVTSALKDAFGGILSAGGVSRIVAAVDEQIRHFHRRPLSHGYRYVFFDAKHGYTSHKRKKRGRGKKKKGALLLAWGIRYDQREELIDFRAVDGETQNNWTSFMTDLEARGLKEQNPWGQRLEMIVSDGDQGLLGSLYMVYPTVPKQRCIFHKIQGITDHLCDRENRKAILASASRIYENLRTRHQAYYRLGKWVERWKANEPEAVQKFLYDFEFTLTYLNAPEQWRSRLKTTNPLERFIRELNKKFKKVGIFPSSRSWERAAFVVWHKLKTGGYAPTKHKDTQTVFTPTS